MALHAEPQAHLLGNGTFTLTLSFALKKGVFWSCFRSIRKGVVKG